MMAERNLKQEIKAKLKDDIMQDALSRFADQYPGAVAQLNAHAQLPISTNLVVFHTMLDLSGIDTPYKKDSLALSNKEFNSLSY